MVLAMSLPHNAVGERLAGQNDRERLDSKEGGQLVPAYPPGHPYDSIASLGLPNPGAFQSSKPPRLTWTQS